MELHQVSGRSRWGLGLAAFTALQWGSLPIMLKGLAEGLDVYTIVWCRFAIMTAFLAIWLAYRGGFAALAALRGTRLVLLVICMAGLCSNYILYMIALERLTPSFAQVLIQFSFVFLLLGSLVLFSERFAPNQWLGLAVLLVGMLLFFNQRYGELMAGGSVFLRGGLIMVVAALAWASYALAQKQLLRHIAPEPAMFAIWLCGTLAFLPFSRLGDAIGLGSTQTILLIACGVITLVSYMTFARALDHVEASRVSIVLSTAPLVTVGGMATWARFFPELLAPEKLNALSIAGACLVVLGSALSSWRPGKA